MKFIVFLKGTLGKMVATKTLPNDFINLQFWQSWPQKFYNIKSYDKTKNEVNNREEDDDDNDDEEEEEEEEQPLREQQLQESPIPNSQLNQDDHHHDEVLSQSIIPNSQVILLFS